MIRGTCTIDNLLPVAGCNRNTCKSLWSYCRSCSSELQSLPRLARTSVHIVLVFTLTKECNSAITLKGRLQDLTIACICTERLHEMSEQGQHNARDCDVVSMHLSTIARKLCQRNETSASMFRPWPFSCHP